MILRNTDLLVDNLYYLLWLKDSGLKDASFNVKIPDTIILQSGKIMNWFFSSKNGEGVLMKKDFNLKNTKIFESFTKKESKSGIVALFIENIKPYDNEDDQAKKSFLTARNNKEESKVNFDIPKNEGNIVIRYLSKENLKEMLFTDLSENRSGILQKFIDPYGENQSVIQAIWSPQLCIFSKRVNYRHLYDKRYDPYERLPTFDGAEMYSRTVPLRGKVISQEMRKFCENIVQRIAHVSFQKIMIQRMVVYFKADRNNNLYYLYCSSLRLHGEKIDPDILDQMPYKIQNTPLILDTNYARPEEIKLIQTTNTMRPISLQNNLQCFYCQQKIQAKDLVPVTYEFIINNFEENPHAKYSKVSNIPVLEVPKEQNFIMTNEEYRFVKDKTSEIPELLTKLYPKLTVENYHKFRQSKKFLNQKIRLCQNCYLDFSRYIKMSGAPLKGVQDFRFMKKGLSKKGSLFTREMKAIVAAKNVEITEQKGSEFVKYQNKEVYQRMLDHLIEEMEIINREKKKIVDLHIPSLKQRSQEDIETSDNRKLEISTSVPNSSTNNKYLLQRPQSCKNFNTAFKLKEIQKQIQLFDGKLGSDQNSQGYQNNQSRQKSDNQSPSTRQKSKEYLDREYLELNEYDPFMQQTLDSADNYGENKFINPEKAHQQAQLEYQYKLNANFIKTKKQQLIINKINSASAKELRQHPKRPSSNTINSSNYKLFQNSTKDSHPHNGNVHHQRNSSSGLNPDPYQSQNTSLKSSIKRVGSFTINKPYRIQTAQTQYSKQTNNNNNNYGTRNTLRSPTSTKFSSQSALQSNKFSQHSNVNPPQKVSFSTLTRPQSHYVSSNPFNLQSSPQEDQRVKTDYFVYPQTAFQDKFIKGSINPKAGFKFQDNEPIAEQMYDDFEIVNGGDSEGFNYENLDFDFQEVNQDYCNQRD